MSDTPKPHDHLLALLDKHRAERKALLDRFEVELRNPIVKAFLRPNSADYETLHGGCAVLTSHPFTIVWVDEYDMPVAVLKRDGKGRMENLCSSSTVIGVKAEDAAKLQASSTIYLAERAKNWRSEIWSTDALSLYLELVKAQWAVVHPIIDAELAAGKAAEVTP